MAEKKEKKCLKADGFKGKTGIKTVKDKICR